MGNSDEAKSSKPEKSSSPAPDQANVHVYPDWAAMQAYYGPRVAVPPYFNSAVASGHPPHPYMWGPAQPMMSPYGTPYAAIYPHGGVYAHPGVPLGSHANGHGVLPSPTVTEATAAVPLSLDTPVKSSANTDKGFTNKLKGFDGLAMSIGNGSSDRAGAGSDHGISQSEDTEGSSDGSNGNTTKVGQNNKKRSREGTPSDAAGEGKNLTPKSPIRTGEVNGTSAKVMGMTVATANEVEKVMGSVLSPNMTSTLELRNPSGGNMKTSPVSEAWLQNERELKRERRKQSNRESARRSRLRKQAETEELAKKVQSLTAENLSLKSEIHKLTESSERLKLENATMMEKLKNPQLGQTGNLSLSKFDEMRLQPVGTANLLARVNNSGSVDRNDEEGEVFENTKSGAKLRQLLDANPRTDAVAAG
ncbi:common plant regulatory factor 1 isoform X2 [Coffea arabica]|uniref:Common plant regulatory factor 1-like isoform X2 n=1 Tax=Coffea arabica TaxID=13443 RepID=A0A6P6VZG5_COFAR|nr:common plant regulatory factor 1-like isoform X2 [Coffea arabica]XP_027108495.1 common plant regulatory factor 1-like isoform X2 [Coffea arabica]